MFAAIKNAFRTKSGKRSLTIMTGCILLLLLLGASQLNLGKFTYVVFFLLAGGVVASGDHFVKIATYYMQRELDKKK